MWSVFIADDEPKIRRRLRRLVESFGEQFQVCGEAADGMEAIERIGEELPDILLVDICMPRLNGLDFIQRIGENSGNTVIIVITGHDEFDYARRAVQLPIFEYVLKPVVSVDLKEIFLRASSELHKSREQNDLLQWAEQEVRRNRTELIKELFDDWLHGLSNPEEIEERKRVLDLDSITNPWLMVIQINALCYGITAIEHREQKILKVAANKIAEEVLGEQHRWIHFEDRHDRLLYLTEGILSEKLPKLIRTDIQTRLNIPVRTGIAICDFGYDAFLQGYDNLCKSINKTGIDGVFIQNVYSFLNENYTNNNLDLNMAASELSYSSGYVSRLLKQCTGYSFSEFTNRYRVLQAIRLLDDNDKMIYEIAEEVGYTSQHYFSRIFKRITGSSPVDYRKEQGVNE
ncbi:MAG: hypothetical protein DRP70_10655 [Spirochaetes bacterium]|nr:MAG: hypothetical protein DRP70_10655 [Spirochaetota bacterium]